MRLSASGEALRLAKATFWAAAPRGPTMATMACPRRRNPERVQHHTLQPLSIEFKSQTDNFVLFAISIDDRTNWVNYIIVIQKCCELKRIKLTLSGQ